MTDLSTEPLSQLLAIMQGLRDPETGCPWDVQQNFTSIAPYTIEEAYEVADAIERNDMADLKDELGDLLLQVVFHAQIASEAGLFDFADVARSISDKMIRRHPHVFAGEAHSIGWEAIKASERTAKSDDASALAGVAKNLPALMVAEKLQKRAARVGFDWPDAQGPRDKIAEELTELDEAPDAGSRQEEYGDLLFATVNLGRKLKIDPEVALRQANAKFEARFRSMEALVGAAQFATLDLDTQENLWVKVKTQQSQISSAAND